jgi:hypothetical protein
MKMAAFWVAAPCSLADVYQHFTDACSLHHQGLMMKAASTSEMSVNFNQTTQHNHPEDSHMHKVPLL